MHGSMYFFCFVSVSTTEYMQVLLRPKARESTTRVFFFPVAFCSYLHCLPLAKNLLNLGMHIAWTFHLYLLSHSSPSSSPPKFNASTPPTRFSATPFLPLAFLFFLPPADASTTLGASRTHLEMASARSVLMGYSRPSSCAQRFGALDAAGGGGGGGVAVGAGDPLSEARCCCCWSFSAASSSR